MGKIERYATFFLVGAMMVYGVIWMIILPFADSQASIRAFFPKDETGFLIAKWAVLLCFAVPKAVLGFRMMLQK